MILRRTHTQISIFFISCGKQLEKNIQISK